MTDANGCDIKIGMRASFASPYSSFISQKLDKSVTVKAIVGKCSSLGGGPGIRVSGSLRRGGEWSAWVEPRQIAVAP